MLKKTLNKDYTIVLVPHDPKKEVIRLKFSQRWLYGALSMFLTVIFLASASFIYSASLSRRLAHYYLALENEKEQQLLISQFSNKTELIQQALSDLSQRENELRKMLGLKRKNFGLSFAKLKLDPIKGLETADILVATKKDSLSELQDRVGKVKLRFAGTPSIWPVKGNITSFFGYRYTPWSGFHAGVDIKAKYGTPIRSSAGGRVKYAGWIRGYGKAVIVEHGNNLSTLYGHLSNMAVTENQKVVKGQLIGNIGNTGYSTGPHLHYEVRWAGKAINPVRYLNMNIFTASRGW